MNKSKLKNILRLVVLVFFISSGILSSAYSFVNCDFQSCCETDCCEENESYNTPIESSFTPETNCCDINEGTQSNFEYSVMYVPHTKINAPIIFNHSNNTSIKETNKIHSWKCSIMSPILNNFIPALRI